LLCDAAVASTTATFADEHVGRYGVAAGDGGTMLWPLLLGIPLAREVLLRGRELDARAAKDLHLVSAIVEEQDLIPKAVEVATELANLSPLAYLATKQTLNNWWRLSSMLSWDLALAFETAALVQPSFNPSGLSPS
jgi:enoyl-CoA hydratase/carnithine racemase